MTRSAFIWTSPLLMALAGCIDTGPFVCQANSQCVFEGTNGMCEATGFCSFPDGGCASGRRYGESGGDGLADQCVPPGTVATDPSFCSLSFDDLTAGAAHACALDPGVEVWCWGDNTTGSLGDGTTETRPEPVRVLDSSGEPFTSVTSVCAGHGFTCAEGGGAWCWGANDAGQLGNGSAAASRSTPAPVGASPMDLLNAVERISCGARHACVVLSMASVQCWGDNTFGQLGDGTSDAKSSIPVHVSGLDAVRVAAGTRHTCALAMDGTVWCWGANDVGQLGDGTTASSTMPVQVLTEEGPPLANVDRLTAGDDFTCAISRESMTGTVRCWGSNASARLGIDVASASSNVATTVVFGGGAPFEVAASISSATHTCAQAPGGTAWCWGDNTALQLGRGGVDSSVEPVQVELADGALKGVESVSAGGTHTCILDSAGDVFCWGGNGAGQLGRPSAEITGSAMPIRAGCPPE